MYFELFGSIAIISLVSFAGVFTLKIKEKKLEPFIEMMVAFAIGALIGDVFLHLLPEISESGITSEVSFSILAGIVTFFVLEKLVHWQHCHHIGHGKTCHRFTYMSIFGDLIHNLIDGIILGGAFMANPVVGFSTTLAVFLHEVPQEIGDFAVLVKGGFTKQKALLYNFITSLSAFLGAIIALLFGVLIEGITPLMMAFAAGSFLYIAGTDLFPELHKEFSPKQAILQLFFICLGIAVMASLLLLE